MAVTIDEMTAEIAAPAETRAAPPAATPAPAREEQLRRERDQLEHLQRRDARVHAD